MGENVANYSSAKSGDLPWVLALSAPSLSSSVRFPQHKEKKPLINEKTHEEHWDILFICQGQDIGDKVLTYFQNIIKCSTNSIGYVWKGRIMSAIGIVLHPILDKEIEGSCVINTLGGTFIISEDGQVHQSGPLIISYFDSSCNVIGGLVTGRLVAAGPVQIVVSSVS